MQKREGWADRELLIMPDGMVVSFLSRGADGLRLRGKLTAATSTTVKPSSVCMQVRSACSVASHNAVHHMYCELITCVLNVKFMLTCMCVCKCMKHVLLFLEGIRHGE